MLPTPGAIAAAPSRMPLHYPLRLRRQLHNDPHQRLPGLCRARVLTASPATTLVRPNRTVRHARTGAHGSTHHFNQRTST